ncbi:MAG: hypothetical protein K2Q26_13035 [Bdellovibrionales bacterium]|nr:hypothetical protein [Bdellovibrionales bacterium]
MRITLLFVSFWILSVQALALDNLSKPCIEAGTRAVIDYLEKEQPAADLHYTVDKNGDINGVVDSAEVYGGFDLQELVTDGTDEAIIYFNDLSYIVFVTVKETVLNGKVQCEIVNVDAGQDDQD